VSLKELCRKHGFGDASLYTWRDKLGGLKLLEAIRLKVPEQENTRLKKLQAESMLDKKALEAALRNKIVSPQA
jgi:putative transposase